MAAGRAVSYTSFVVRASAETCVVERDRSPMHAQTFRALPYLEQ